MNRLVFKQRKINCPGQIAGCAVTATVEKATNSCNRYSQWHTETNAIHNAPERNSFYFKKEQVKNEAADQRTVEGKAALFEGKKIFEIKLLGCVFKNEKQARTADSDYQLKNQHVEN
jgi:hypothetical protein